MISNDTTALVDPFKPWPLRVTMTTAEQVVSVRMIPEAPRGPAPRTDVYAEPLAVVGPVRSGSLRRFVPSGTP